MIAILQHPLVTRIEGEPEELTEFLRSLFVVRRPVADPTPVAPSAPTPAPVAKAPDVRPVVVDLPADPVKPAPAPKPATASSKVGGGTRFEAPETSGGDFGPAFRALHGPKYAAAIAEGIAADPDSGVFWVVLAGTDAVMSLSAPVNPANPVQRVFLSGRDWCSLRAGGGRKVVGRVQDPDNGITIGSSLRPAIEGGK